MILRPLLCLLVLAAIGCKSQDKEKKDAALTTQEQTGLTLLMTDFYGGTETPDFRVIRDMKSLRQFFIQVNKTRKPGIPVPEVDFEREMVLLHCPGASVHAPVSKLFIKEDARDRMVLGLKPEKVKQKSENEALIMPFSLYTIPFTEKEIIIQKE